MPISREVCSQAPQPVLRHDQVRLGCVLAYHEGARLAFNSVRLGEAAEPCEAVQNPRTDHLVRLVLR